MNDIQDFQIIGIDCAADPKDIGVAYAKMAGRRFTVEHVGFGVPGKQNNRSHRLKRLAKNIVERIQEARVPTLLALDAPLGWPIRMGSALAAHWARELLPDDPDADRFFRRCTDRFVAEKTGKTPLEVGANLIARASHTALRLVEMLRSSDGMPDFPLRSQDSIVWRVCGARQANDSHLIEVYPALAGPFFLSSTAAQGTANYWRELASDLKKMKKDKSGNWCEQLRQVGNELTEGKLIVHLNDAALADTMETKRHRDHGLDAILCAWTGFRFLQGKCVEPPPAGHGEHDDYLKREGWIWFDRRAVIR